MAGDFSRNSVNRAAGYTGVLMQQGRVQLDADWNEQLALAQHRMGAETRDVIGCCGTPKGENGFRIEATPDHSDLFILPGRFYAGGLLCEIDPQWVDINPDFKTPFRIAGLPSLWLDGRHLRRGDWVEIRAAKKTATLRTRILAVSDEKLEVLLSDSFAAYENQGQVFLRRALTYLTQPFYTLPAEPGSPLSGPNGEGLDLADGEYLVYLEAWQREVNALEDPHLREVALGGPDTAERLQTVWQVKVRKIAEHVELPPDGEHRPCQDKLPEWTNLVAAARTTGQMNARSTPQKADSNPCVLPPSAGFTGLENQLYRIEIFNSGDTLADATYVWSRDNAMVETTIVSVDSTGTVLTVTDLGKDDLHSFNVNDWVEVVDRASELNGSARFLARITTPAPDPTSLKITLSAAVPNAHAINSAANSPDGDVFRLRRWDMTGASVSGKGIPLKAGWLAIENGVEVSFTEGSYVSRSFWLVPARTATADVEWPPFQVPNTQPVPQTPLGEFHQFCRLALIESVYSKWTIGDCRIQFPNLGNICADDVCYHSDCDCLKGAETVKDALDELCEAVKLRFHKKYLHGWGIVCGLEVTCGGANVFVADAAGGNAAGVEAPGANVTVGRGYAIDCQGNDILLLKPETFNVLSAIQTPSGVADGAYSLFFDTQHNNQLKVEPYKPPANKVANALAGTFWADYYTDYLKPLIDAWQMLDKTPVNAIIRDGQRTISSLTNLLVQFATPQTGSGVYISKDEHSFLQKFYFVLKNALRDNTFCGSGDDLVAPPEYPATIGGTGTGFGEGFKTRLRINDAGTFAASVGNNNEIHIYQIQAPDLVLSQVLTFPGDANLVVQDVAFGSDNDTFYAIATAAGNSTFASTKMSAIAWSSVAIPGVTLASLVVLSSVPYAAGIGKGLYACTTGTLAFGFNAIGQVVLADSGVLYATANSAASVTSQFDEVISIAHTPSGFGQTGVWSLANQGVAGTLDDDLNVVVTMKDTEVVTQTIYVTAAPPAAGSNKVLLVDYAPGQGTSIVSWTTLNLGESSRIRLAWHAGLKQMMLSFAGSNRIAALTETTNTVPGTAVSHSLSLSNAFPAEVTPASLVYHAKAGLLVLNAISNTITAIPAATALWTSAQYTALSSYRTAMLESYVAMFGVLVQYLKDGFCELLLLKCQVCDQEPDKPVYLAGITVKGGKVYKICNLTERRYVKTFPGVEYWLSIVPIIPLVELAIREFCCQTYTDNFAKIAIPQPSNNVVNTVGLPSASAAFTAAKNLKAINLASFQTAIQNKISPASGITADYVKNLFTTATSAPAVSASSVNGKAVQQAQQALAQQGVTVNVASYDPSQVASNVFSATTAPSQIPAGSTVTLFADQTGNVKYFSIAPVQVQELQTQVTAVQKEQATVATQDDITALKTQIATLQTSYAQQLALRDTQITQLQTSLTTVNAQIAKLTPPPAPAKG